MNVCILLTFAVHGVWGMRMSDNIGTISRRYAKYANTLIHQTEPCRCRQQPRAKTIGTYLLWKKNVYTLFCLTDESISFVTVNRADHKKKEMGKAWIQNQTSINLFHKSKVKKDFILHEYVHVPT